MEHHYGDACYNGHFIEDTPEGIQELLRGKPYPPSGGMIDDQIQKLSGVAQNFYERAMEYERLANDRAALLREAEYAIHQRRAKAGNPLSKRALQSAGTIAKYAEVIASSDPKWQAHVANNQFYTRKADMTNSMVQTLLALKSYHDKGGI